MPPGTRVYLLDEWYKNTAIVQTADGHTFVVGTALKPKLVLAALHKLGRRQADVVFSLDNKPVASGYNEVSPKIVRPFVDVWPDDNAESFGKTAVRIVWGIHETKNGRIWYNTGYSGTDKDDVSACFGEKKHSFCLGAGAQFVQTEKTLTRAAVNQTVEVRL